MTPLRRVGEAPAKVNLFLRILAREETGYHQLETEYQALELADRVALTLDPGAPPSITLEVEGVPPGALGPPENNLMVRAARALLAHRGLELPGHLHLHLRKDIPHGAGLGGGSSDAAQVLLGLNALLAGDPGSSMLPDRAGLASLLDVAGGLGADVPFFVTGVPRARAWGRGDRLLPLPPLPPVPVALLVPPEGIATPVAYQTLAAWRRAAGHTVRSAGSVPAATTWAEVVAEAENDFEAALHPHHPSLPRLARVLREMGASPVLLSGSGSAVFGLFTGALLPPSRPEVEALARAVVPGVRVFLTRTRGADGTGEKIPLG